MALVSSGQITISSITIEKGDSLLTNVSLNSLSTVGINQNSFSKPNGSQPHSMSEFYGYNHTYSPPVTEYEVEPITISTAVENSEEACFAFGTQEVFKTGDAGIVQQGNTFHSESPGTPDNQINMWPFYFNYVNPDFGKVVFSFDDGNQVNDPFITGCGRSERRLKYNIEYITDSPMGIPMYYFNYINEAHGKGRYVGTMVDDLQRLGYSDVLSTVNGDVYVNYAKIDVPFMKLED